METPSLSMDARGVDISKVKYSLIPCFPIITLLSLARCKIKGEVWFANKIEFHFTKLPIPEADLI